MLLASVFLASLVTANTSTYGSLLPEYVDYFQVSKSKITLIQSLCAGAAAAIGKTFYINSNSIFVNLHNLMIGLRYGFYPRVTHVISRMSEVRANHEIIYLSHFKPFYL